MISHVPNVEAKVIFPSESKNSDFTSSDLAMNNCNQVTVHILVSSASSLNAEATLQFTIDGTSWLTYNDSKVYLNRDDDIFITLNDVQSFLRMRVNVDLLTGSAIFKITARTV